MAKKIKHERKLRRISFPEIHHAMNFLKNPSRDGCGSCLWFGENYNRDVKLCLITEQSKDNADRSCVDDAERRVIIANIDSTE